MGKWNYRRLPRRKYQNTEENYVVHDPKILTPDDWKSNVPSWEKQFCLTVGSVPWNKVLIVKKFMGCHDSVLRWKSSGDEEAFTNAKERFRADIEGRPCNIPLPDPSMYIEEVDWNPNIDPELIVDLEKVFFNPDEDGDLKTVENVEQKSHNNNPWEGDLKTREAPLKDMIERSNWGDGLIDEESNKKTSNGNEKNPWEDSNIQVKGGRGATWWSRSEIVSGGYEQKEKVHDDRIWSNNFNSNYRSQDVRYSKDSGWCNSSTSYKTQNQVNNDQDWGWRQQPAQNGQWRKREGPPQYSSRRKNSRFDGDDCVGDRHWRK